MSMFFNKLFTILMGHTEQRQPLVPCVFCFRYFLRIPDRKAFGKQIRYNIHMKNRLKELREKKGLAQTALAKQLNMSQTGYSKYETDENDIPTKVLIALAELHEVSVGYLLRVEN